MQGENIISGVVQEAGHIGLGYIGIGIFVTILLCLCILFLYFKYIKSDNKIQTDNGLVDKDSFLLEYLHDLKDDLKYNSTKLNDELKEFKTDINERFKIIEHKIESIPIQSIQELIECNKKMDKQNFIKHQKAFEDALRLGDEIYDILLNYTNEINCQHIFVGSFHNGSENLDSIPYIKMDIIREVYHSTDMHENDHSFAPVYKDCELSLLGKLPKMLIQNKLLYFTIDDNNKSDMFKYDSLVVRRMIGMGIKQIALHVTQEKNIASGFVGCVRYDNKEMNLNALELCVKELELIHNTSKGL